MEDEICEYEEGLRSDCFTFTKLKWWLLHVRILCQAHVKVCKSNDVWLESQILTSLERGYLKIQVISFSGRFPWVLYLQHQSKFANASMLIKNQRQKIIEKLIGQTLQQNDHHAITQWRCEDVTTLEKMSWDDDVSWIQTAITFMHVNCDWHQKHRHKEPERFDIPGHRDCWLHRLYPPVTCASWENGPSKAHLTLRHQTTNQIASPLQVSPSPNLIVSSHPALQVTPAHSLLLSLSHFDSPLACRLRIALTTTSA